MRHACARPGCAALRLQALRHQRPPSAGRQPHAGGGGQAARHMRRFPPNRFWASHQTDFLLSLSLPVGVWQVRQCCSLWPLQRVTPQEHASLGVWFGVARRLFGV
jgi:hypothetical protein